MKCLNILFCLLLYTLTEQFANCREVTVSTSFSEVVSVQDNNTRLIGLVENFKIALAQGKSYDEFKSIVDQIESILASDDKNIDSLVLADGYYSTGIFYLSFTKYDKARQRFLKVLSIKEKRGEIDRRYAGCLGNLSVTYYKMGDYPEALNTGLKALRVGRTVVDSDSSVFAGIYLNLASTYLEMNRMDNAKAVAEKGLEIVRLFPGKVTNTNIAAFYHDLGISLARKSENAKALYYYKQALPLYESDENTLNESKQLLLVAMANAYEELNETGMAEDYYKKALSLVDINHPSDNFLVYPIYAGFLNKNGRLDEGIQLFDSGLEMVRRSFGVNSREYCLMLSNDAAFIYKSTGNSEKAIDIYNQCMFYLSSHQNDFQLTYSVSIDYVRILMETKRYSEALNIIDNLLGHEMPGSTNKEAGNAMRMNFANYQMRTMYSIRYEALNYMAEATGDVAYKKKAIETGRSLISLFDRMRSEMSEEESRNFLSMTARKYYTGIINNYADLYEATGDPELLSGAYEYCERSKLANFLASMRELNATRFSLPENLVSYNNQLQKQIGTYRELINNESAKSSPDSMKIATLETSTFRLLRVRDSLIRVFEEKYPVYYNLKYQNDITSSDKVLKVLGNRANFVSYILTEDKLYIFLINRSDRKLFIAGIDSTFYAHFNRFRELLTTMPNTGSARASFDEYISLGHELYCKLIQPVEPYLKGDRIVISPDNILSYLPFEALISENYKGEDLLYREAPFALKKFRFSYIYSVTLSSETGNRSRSMINRLIAFAPSYDKMEVPDSILNIYPNLRGGISVLPYASAEAEDAVEQCGGKAMIGPDATEVAYKANARNFSIIHLAMHTLLNDQYPDYSKMIFTKSKEPGDDGFLNAYEVYNTPLNAMMVVLSSCNTGSGLMITGEGILSLARGFLFAGSRSVVMSMWEVEDYAGSEVVKSFYHYIRAGKPKSLALRNARLDFLHKADQVRSHPYYWSTLVIYGDDAPLYFNRNGLIAGGVLILITLSVIGILYYKGPRS